MRITLRLLGRSRNKTVSNVLNHHASSTPSFPWLSDLKTKQLQHLAQRTGLPSSGTKAVLIEELERGLTLYQEQHGEKLFQSNEEPENNDLAKVHGHGNEDGDGDGKDKELRILSIDMGIRNLAFAVLNVRGFGDGLGSGSTLGLLAGRLERPNQGRRNGNGARGFDNEDRNEGGGAVRVSLEAWRRVSLPLDRGLSVEEFGRYLDSPYSAFPSTMTLASAPLPGSEFESGCLDTDEGISMTASPTAKRKKGDKAPFSVPIYATHAHSIISALLARYDPTHVLIERQRFRSGGGSAVQEWSLRVGVFEGMLWATLHSLRMKQNQNQNRAEQDGTAPRVISIEPARIGRFWAPITSSPSGSDVSSSPAAASGDGEGKKKSKKKTSSSREGKKLKIDLVGSWLEQDLFLTGHGHTVQPWVDAYMAKWKKSLKLKQRPKSKTKTKSKSTASDPASDCVASADADTVDTGVDIAKLDDMADCLVQGVTWLEWEGMKGRVVREGIGGVVGVVDVPV
ncbi:mitochondrial resolvase Ydc2 [Aspergillus falconensis]